MPKVLIKRSAKDYYSPAECDVEQINNVHWDNLSGGYHQKQAGFSLYGYIPYKLAEKLVACSGNHEYMGNDVKIVIPANLNNKPPFKEGYKILSKNAGEKPQRTTVGTPCTKAIIKILNEANNHTLERKMLRAKLLEKGYEKNRILHAIRRLESQGKIKTSGSSYSIFQKITSLVP